MIILNIGDRICTNIQDSIIHDHGTVRYIGSLPDLQNEWIGIEWDHFDESKTTRHSGQWKGIYYFYTKRPKTASFVSKTQLISILEKRQYHNCIFSKEFSEKYKDINPLIVKLPHIKIIDSIDCALSLKLSKVIELDLSNSLFCKFSDISVLLSNMHKLSRLSLSRCRFEELDNSAMESFPIITLLNISDTLISWKDIEIICQITFPNLLELVCSSNYLHDIDDSSIISNSIESLSMEHNNFTLLQFITRFPSLKSLNASFNPLKNQLLYHSKELPLSSLIISVKDNDQLINWTSWIETIRIQFPHLTKLSCRSPLAEIDTCPLMMYIISNIPSLKVINGSTLTYSWRRSLEKLHVQYALNHIEYQGWRYSELLSMYSESKINELFDSNEQLNEKLSKNRLIHDIKLDRNGSICTLPPLSKAMNILQLKRLLHNIYSIPWNLMTKLSIQAEGTEKNVHLDRLLKPLSEYIDDETLITLKIY